MNHYILSTRLKIMLVVIFTLCTMSAFAAPPGFDDDEGSGVDDQGSGDGDGDLPINNAVYFMMAAGMLYGYSVLQKKKQVQ
jgi:hypothetical protein